MSTEPEEAPLVLKRETILPSSDRGRLAAIVATCSMAGLAGGMALSMLAESQRVAAGMRRDAVAAQMRLEERSGDAHATWLGLQISDAPGKCGGAVIAKVVPDSPADRVGFHVGDVVDTFGGDVVCDDDHLVAVVRGSMIGASPAVTVRRGLEHLTFHPTLSVRPTKYR